MFGRQSVTHAGFGAKVAGACWVGFQFSPKLQHVDSQIMNLVFMIWAPDFDQQLSVCNNSVRVTNQNLKKLEFDARQVHFRSSHEQSSFVEIHLDVARSKYRCLFAPSSSSARN